MIVNVKLNNLVWLLTGRSSGFAYPLLNTYVSVPYAPDPRVRRARALLKLDVVGIDFFVYGALTALYSSLYYVRDLDVGHQAAFVPGVIPFTYRGSDVYQRVDGEVVYVLNVPQPVADSNEWTFLPYYDETTLSVSRNVCDWDAPHDSLQLAYLDGPDTLTVTKYWLGVAGISRDFSVTPVADVVTLDAWEFCGLRASFAKNVSDSTSLNTPPVLYPYGTLRARIANESDMITLMTDAGTIGAFYDSTNDMTAIGALAAAIVRVTKAGAAGPDYEVTLEPPAGIDGIPDTMQMVVRFDPVTLDTPI